MTTRPFLLGLATILTAVVAVIALFLYADPETHPPHAARPTAGALAPLPLAVTGGDSTTTVEHDITAWVEGEQQRERWIAGVQETLDREAREAASRAVPASPRSSSLPRESGPTDWDGVAQCETAGNWGALGPTYQGGLGIYGAAWVQFGGLEFADNAGLATREQQIIVAERIKAYNGGSLYGAWGCAEYG